MLGFLSVLKNRAGKHELPAMSQAEIKVLAIRKEASANFNVNVNILLTLCNQ